MAKKQKHDSQFFLALLAVVFGAAAVIMLRAGGPGSLGVFWTQSAESVEVLGAETPDQLMESLDETSTIDKPGEFAQLRNEVKGL